MWIDPQGRVWKSLPNFSTSLPDAMLVVDQMKAEGFAFDWKTRGKEVVVTFSRGFLSATGIADAIPHAICLAALRVRELEESA